jgi:hypothetical protein
MSEGFVPLSLETVEGVFAPPNDCAKGVLSVSHKELLLLFRRKGAAIPFKKGIH